MALDILRTPITLCSPRYTNTTTGKKKVVNSLAFPQPFPQSPVYLSNPTPSDIASYYFKNNDNSSVKQLPPGYLTRCGQTWEDVCPGYNHYTMYQDRSTNCDVPDTIYVGHHLVTGVMSSNPGGVPQTYMTDVTLGIATDSHWPPVPGEVGGKMKRSFMSGWTYALPRSSRFWGGANPNGGTSAYIPASWGTAIRDSSTGASNWQNLTREIFLSDEFRLPHDPTNGERQYLAGGIGSVVDKISTLLPCSPIVYSGDYENRWGMHGNSFFLTNLNSLMGTHQGCNYGGMSSWGCPGYSVQGAGWPGTGINNDAMDRMCHLPWPAHHRSGQFIAEDNGYGDFPPHSFLAPWSLGSQTAQAATCYTHSNIMPLWWIITGANILHPSPGVFMGQSSGGSVYNAANAAHPQSTGGSGPPGLPHLFRPYPDYPIDPNLPQELNANAFKKWSDAKEALFTVYGPANWPIQRMNCAAKVWTGAGHLVIPPLWIPIREDYEKWGMHDVNFYLRVWMGHGRGSSWNDIDQWEYQVSRIDWNLEGGASNNRHVCIGCCQSGYKGQVQMKIGKTETEEEHLLKLRKKRR